jgi:xanthine/CO dehydrogenase XdhC/CoxF family maturation factor
MKIWRETELVYGELLQRLERGEPAAVATLIRLEGSAYRRPGAKLLIGHEGALFGNVSGGCLEEDLRERGLRALKTGQPERVHYDTGSDENVVWGLGLGCDGRLDLWLQPYTPATDTTALRDLRARLHGATPFTLTLALTDGRLTAGAPGPATGLIGRRARPAIRGTSRTAPRPHRGRRRGGRAPAGPPGRPAGIPRHAGGSPPRLSHPGTFSPPRIGSCWPGPKLDSATCPSGPAPSSC